MIYSISTSCQLSALARSEQACLKQQNKSHQKKKSKIKNKINSSHPKNKTLKNATGSQVLSGVLRKDWRQTDLNGLLSLSR